MMTIRNRKRIYLNANLIRGEASSDKKKNRCDFDWPQNEPAKKNNLTCAKIEYLLQVEKLESLKWKLIEFMQIPLIRRVGNFKMSP